MHILRNSLKQINKPRKIGLYNIGYILSNRNDDVTGGLEKIFCFYILFEQFIYFRFQIFSYKNFYGIAYLFKIGNIGYICLRNDANKLN